jgi:hypothetical protein
MSDDETTDSTEAATPDEPAATSTPSDNRERSTVHIPQWLAGALVVVLALVIGAVGYALGASGNDNDGPNFRPINASQQNGQQGGPGGGFPGGPGGQQRGQQGPGGQHGGPGGGPSFDDRGERGDRQGQDDQDSQDDDSDDDQDEDATN